MYVGHTYRHIIQEGHLQDIPVWHFSVTYFLKLKWSVFLLACFSQFTHFFGTSFSPGRRWCCQRFNATSAGGSVLKWSETKRQPASDSSFFCSRLHAPGFYHHYRQNCCGVLVLLYRIKKSVTLYWHNTHTNPVPASSNTLLELYDAYTE